MLVNELLFKEEIDQTLSNIEDILTKIVGGVKMSGNINDNLAQSIGCRQPLNYVPNLVFLQEQRNRFRDEIFELPAEITETAQYIDSPTLKEKYRQLTDLKPAFQDKQILIRDQQFAILIDPHKSKNIN